METSNSKSYKIQLLRGLAIIAVVFIHNLPLGMTQVLVRPFLNFSVGMFLFLSAMLSNADSWKPWKRISKILIPYIIWTMIYTVLYNYHTPTQMPVIYLKQLITAKTPPIMYYVFVYCEFTMLIPLIDKLAKSKYRLLGFVIAPIEIIFMRLIPLLLGYEMNSYLIDIIHISCLAWFTYFYLGYLLGNGLLKLKIANYKLLLIWAATVILQILEGYYYYSIGETNCGTQVKLTAVLTGSIFVLIAFRFINANKCPKVKALVFLGDCSFGIFFSHLAVMAILMEIPYYSQHVSCPANAILTIIASCTCVLVGRKIMGKYHKYLAF